MTDRLEAVSVIYFVIALCALAALALIAVYMVYRRVFRSPQRGQEVVRRIPNGPQYAPYADQMYRMIDWLIARPSEDVSIVSRDGLKLAARLYPAPEGAPVAICFHGYRAPAQRDFCGGARALIESGYRVLLVDERAHGRSEGRALTMGVREKYDCADWAKWAAGRFGADTPITLYGISMGAATVLMAAGLDLPKNVRLIVADCPYTTPKAIIRKVIGDLGMPAGLLYPLVAAAARLFAGFDLSDEGALGAVRRARVPIVLLHGEDDRFVPCEMSRELARANEAMVSLYTFPGAAHGMSYMSDPARYLGALAAHGVKLTQPKAPD